MDAAPSPSLWSRLSHDLTDLILSRLPLRSILAASAVCRTWRHIITHVSFNPKASSTPWLFLYGHHNLHPQHNQAFAFDPDSNHWSIISPEEDLIAGHGGYSFASTHSPTRLSYAPLLRGPRRLTSPLSSSRTNPLVSTFHSRSCSAPRFIVVGGARYLGSLVDIEDRLAVEVYNPVSDSWELGPPLPTVFQSGSSSHWLTSALISNNLLFISGIYSGAVAVFNVNTRVWSAVQHLRPPGVLFSFLIASGDNLILAGLCSEAGGARFVVWGVDRVTMGFTEIGAMPREMLWCMFESDDDDGRFASLKCVGLDGLVYVFNEDHHKGYPACVCEIYGGGCEWRKVPPLPGRINQFHKVVAFCSTVPLRSVLGSAVEG